MNTAEPNSATSELSLLEQRRAKLEALKAENQAYPSDFRRTHFADDIQLAYRDHSKETLAASTVRVTVAGRIMLKRGSFMVLQDLTGRIQLYLNRKTLSADILSAVERWDIGDVVGSSGTLQRSGKGDLYVEMDQPRLLNKTLRPLPEKHKGLADQETKYRQRYLDLMVNDETRQVFALRAKMIEFIRQFFAQRQFIEVETPMLQVIPGGATARPFVTHHNAMNIDMYLRIAPELYLKRLVVGGFERVFEINRNFRNEGVSTRHNPEFTMLEFYQAFADYLDLMDLTETLLREMAQALLGSCQLTYQDQTFDLSKPFVRQTMADAVLACTPELQPEHVWSVPHLESVLSAYGLQCKPGWGAGKLLNALFEEVVEPQLQGPIFITEYPAEVSPLARRSDHNPDVTDRFEFFLGGREVANGFTELNDPIDQAERFQAQVAQKDAGDQEAMFFDQDYITALEYGLPPTAGEGIGIDRLVMFFTNSASIKDVILFPHMKPKT